MVLSDEVADLLRHLPHPGIQDGHPALAAPASRRDVIGKRSFPESVSQFIDQDTEEGRLRSKDVGRLTVEDGV